MEKARFFRDARRDLAGPLEGITVVELTTTWAGPMAACMLADHGAQVTKVEHPSGEVARRLPPHLPGTDPPASFMHATVNRNKRSVAIDLHAEEGRALFLELACAADLVIENFKPGTLDGWGVGYEALRARRTDVILISISGYGQYGPDHGRPGYDPLAQAASGFLSLNGSPDGPPVKAPTFFGDDLAGLHAAFAALAALRHRDRHGEGQHVDVALLDCMLFQSTGYLTLAALGEPLERLGNQFRVAAPANSYRCRDGWVMAGVLIDAHWQKLARLIGRPELATHPDYATAPARIARRGEVDGWLGAWLGERSVAESLDAFGAAGLPIAPVRSYAEAATAAHTVEREMLQTPPQPGATIPLAAPPAKFSRTPVGVREEAAPLGAHTREALEELGMAADRIDALAAQGVIRLDDGS